MVCREIGMSSTLAGNSLRKRSAWQSFEVQGLGGLLLKASGTSCRPALAELWLKTTLLRFTEARKDCKRGFLECFPLLIRSAASTTGLLSGKTSVGLELSLIQCLVWSMARTVPKLSMEAEKRLYQHTRGQKANSHGGFALDHIAIHGCLAAPHEKP